MFGSVYVILIKVGEVTELSLIGAVRGVEGTLAIVTFKEFEVTEYPPMLYATSLNLTVSPTEFKGRLVTTKSLSEGFPLT